MTDRFTPLAPERSVFRLAVPESGFLPKGRAIPLPDWLAPTKQDKAEAAGRGRRPGLSVWDSERTTLAQARNFTSKPDGLAFVASVAMCVSIGAERSLEIAVVTDPRDDLAPAPGHEGHSLIEGLAKPHGAAKLVYDDLRRAMVEAFRPVD